MAILYYAATIASLVCWIMVLVKAFQNQKTAIGIIGIICGLVAFVWGWMNAGKLGLQKVMLIWTIAAIVGVWSGMQTGNVTFSTGG